MQVSFSGAIMVNGAWVWLPLLVDPTYRNVVATQIRHRLSPSTLSYVERGATRAESSSTPSDETRAQPIVVDAPCDPTITDGSDLARFEALPSASKPPLTTPAPPEPTCDMCMDAPKTHAFVPCGHVFACEGCAQMIIGRTGVCPVCSQSVSGTLRVFL